MNKEATTQFKTGLTETFNQLLRMDFDNRFINTIISITKAFGDIALSGYETADTADLERDIQTIQEMRQYLAESFSRLSSAKKIEKWESAAAATSVWTQLLNVESLLKEKLTP